jgi:hypothetical protein
VGIGGTVWYGYNEVSLLKIIPLDACHSGSRFRTLGIRISTRLYIAIDSQISEVGDKPKAKSPSFSYCGNIKGVRYLRHVTAIRTKSARK